MSFALSSLVSVLEEQLEILNEEELALITRRFMRFNDNRKNQRRNNNNCFECGKSGHFTADSPDKNKSKNNGYDYNKYKNKDGTKKKKKYTDREKKEHCKKAKAHTFIAFLSDVDSNIDVHTDSSRSEEYDNRKAKKKDGKNFNSLCFYSGMNRDGYCVMALNADSKKDGKESNSDTETEEFKRVDGFGIGNVTKQCRFDGLHEKIFDGLYEKVGGLKNTWLIDSGCSRHMTGDHRWFSSLTPVMTREYITFGDNSKGKVLSEGVIKCLVAGSSSELWKWYRRLGHLSFDLLSRLSALDLIRGLPKLKFEKDLGEHEMGQSIFEGEEEHVDNGDEEDDEIDHAPAVALV
ncbi:uncharacterized protein LOC105913783 [Setaria italica]|uniref:uncharacterized protein LOC105913783 n=1 Tax=Setaria italica TaxID=4555 RepID=UPI0006466A67|nr:uncharacterized protein LOC105913783 [Setaria italica]